MLNKSTVCSKAYIGVRLNPTFRQLIKVVTIFVDSSYPGIKVFGLWANNIYEYLYLSLIWPIADPLVSSSESVGQMVLADYDQIVIFYGTILHSLAKVNTICDLYYCFMHETNLRYYYSFVLIYNHPTIYIQYRIETII